MKLPQTLRALMASTLILTPMFCLGADEETVDAPSFSMEEYEKQVDARIHIAFYKYVHEIAEDAAGFTGDELPRMMKKTDEYIAKGQVNYAAPRFYVNNMSSYGSRVATVATRVPNWYAKADLEFFTKGINQIKADSVELLKITEKLREYYSQKSNYEADQHKTYLDVKGRLTELCDNIYKSSMQVDARAFEMASAAETLLLNADRDHGHILLTLREDLFVAVGIGEIVAELGESDNAEAVAKAKDALPKLCDSLAATIEKNKAMRMPEGVNDEFGRYYQSFLRDCESLIKSAREDVVAKLEANGKLNSGQVRRIESLTNNVVQQYNRFVTRYNYDTKSYAIER